MILRLNPCSYLFSGSTREMLDSASRHRPSKSMELRRAASGLVKVICRTEESRPGGEGKSLENPNRKACQQALRNGLDQSI